MKSTQSKQIHACVCRYETLLMRLVKETSKEKDGEK